MSWSTIKTVWYTNSIDIQDFEEYSILNDSLAISRNAFQCNSAQNYVNKFEFKFLVPLHFKRLLIRRYIRKFLLIQILRKHHK